MKFSYRYYCKEDKKDWDNFVLKDSVNGTFLQTKNFLDYHPVQRFSDCSVLILYKENLIGVVPACIEQKEDQKIFVSHKGSTFGGIVLHGKYYSAQYLNEIINGLEIFLKNEGFSKVLLKITPDIFCGKNSGLFQYILRSRGYDSYEEISTYIDFERYEKDITMNFTSRRRRALKSGLKTEAVFKELTSRESIEELYMVLCDNLKRYDTAPVHSIEELFEFKEKRLQNIVCFWGVYVEENILAGSMTFDFGNVLHTQYLAAKRDDLCPNAMTVLYYYLIDYAIRKGYSKLSWGIATEDRGKILNENLLIFKESFGSDFGINRTFYKVIR